MEKENNHARNVAIGIQILGIIFCFVVFYATMGRWFAKTYTPWMVHGLFLLISIALWATILFKSGMFGWFFIIVKPLHAVVLRSQLEKDELPKTGSGRTTMFHMKSLREVPAGFHYKLPWEMPASEPINLKSEVLIGESREQPLITKTKNGVILKFAWQTSLTPLQGYLCNLVRHTEVANREFFRARFNAELRDWVSKLEELDVQKNLELPEDNPESLKAKFKKVFGGKNKTVKDEMEHGLFSGDPLITAIDRTQEYTDVGEAAERAQKISAAMSELTSKLTEEQKKMVDPGTLMLIASQIAGTTIEGTPIMLFGGGGMSETLKAELLRAAGRAKGGKKGGSS